MNNINLSDHFVKGGFDMNSLAKKSRIFIVSGGVFITSLSVTFTQTKADVATNLSDNYQYQEILNRKTIEPSVNFYPSQITISPNLQVGGGGGGVPSCNGLVQSGTENLTYFTSQVSPTPTFMWSYHITTAGEEALNGVTGLPVTVWITGGDVWSAYDGQDHTLNAGGLYAPHTSGLPYTFHGSVSRWPLMTGNSIPVENGDIVTLYFEADGLLGSIYDGPIMCQVSQEVYSG